MEIVRVKEMNKWVTDWKKNNIKNERNIRKELTLLFSVLDRFKGLTVRPIKKMWDSSFYNNIVKGYLI